MTFVARFLCERCSLLQEQGFLTLRLQLFKKYYDPRSFSNIHDICLFFCMKSLTLFRRGVFLPPKQTFPNIKKIALAAGLRFFICDSKLVPEIL